MLFLFGAVNFPLFHNRFFRNGRNKSGHVAKEIVPSKATTHKKERTSLNANARRPSNAKVHNLILQVNTNDPAAMATSS